MAVHVSKHGFQRVNTNGLVMFLVEIHKAISLLLSDPKHTVNFHCYSVGGLIGLKSIDEQWLK